MTSLIIALWSAGIAAKSYAAFRLWRENLVERFPTLLVLLIVLSAQSFLALVLSGNSARYRVAYSLIGWTSVLAEGFAVAGVFWALAEFYPQFRVSGSIVLCTLALLGATICWAVGYVAPPSGWSGAWRLAIWAERAISLVSLCVLVGTRLFLPRVGGIPIRRSARRASDILTLHVCLCLIIAALGVTTGMRYPATMSFLAVLNGLVFGVLCVTFLTAESDGCRQAAPRHRVNMNLVFARALEEFRHYNRVSDHH